MTITRRPYFYTHCGNFTNRKHREVRFSFVIDPDAERYELQAVHHSSKTAIILIKFPKLSGAWLVVNDFPTPIVPPVDLASGTILECVVSLPSEKNIGRERPRFTVQLMGANIYVDS